MYVSEHSQLSNSKVVSVKQQRIEYCCVSFYVSNKGITYKIHVFSMYNGHRDAQSLKRWLQGFIPSPVTPLSSKEFRKEVLSKQYFLPWLINFYAPWCGHCVQFEPDFISIGQVFDARSFFIFVVGITQFL